MRLFATMGLILAMSSVANAQQTQLLTPPAQAANQKENQTIYSYGIGYNIGMNLSTGGLTAGDVSQEQLVKGLLDALSKKDSVFKPEQVQAAMAALDNMFR